MKISRRSFVAGAVVAAAAVHTGCKAKVTRSVELLVDGDHVRDGAGVKLRRLVGGRTLSLVDPFLLLDEFKSHERDDFIRGFPQHPHRGFETVTLMIDGVVNHRDSVGNHGAIVGGGVQWMTAGHGIVHEEMPDASPTTGALWGYQLWVNLPAKLKMQKPRYQELKGAYFPLVDVDDAVVRVIAGEVLRRRGPIDGIAVQPTALDVALAPGARFRHDVPRGDTVVVFALDRSVEVGGTVVPEGSLAVLSPGDVVDAKAPLGARAFILAGAPIGEPVARRGPFVMNTEAELDQAFADYKSGRLTAG